MACGICPYISIHICRQLTAACDTEARLDKGHTTVALNRRFEIFKLFSVLISSTDSILHASVRLNEAKPQGYRYLGTFERPEVEPSYSFC